MKRTVSMICILVMLFSLIVPISASVRCSTPQMRPVEWNTDMDGGLLVRWDPVEGDENGYAVFRRENGSAWKRIGYSDSTGYRDGKVLIGNTYTYTVRVIDESGRYISGYDPQGESLTYYAPPRQKRAYSTTDGVCLSWDSVYLADRYQIERQEERIAEDGWSVIAQTPQLTYTDHNVSSGVCYHYRLRSVNEDGEPVGGYSNGFTITYLSVPKITKIENTVVGTRLTWNKTAGAKKYRVYVKNGSVCKRIGETAKSSFTYTSTKSGTRYTYTVRAVDIEKNALSGYSSTGRTKTFIAAPMLTAKKTKQGVSIKWNRSAGAAQYRVFRKTADGGWIRLVDTKGLSFTDSKIKKGVRYTYTVRCLSKDKKNYTSAYRVGIRADVLYYSLIKYFNICRVKFRITALSSLQGASLAASSALFCGIFHRHLF